MAAGADALAGAKAAASHAENFEKSVTKQVGHEYSHAPYEMAAKARKEAPSSSKPAVSSSVGQIGQEAHDAGAGIAERIKAVKELEDSSK